jgi:hypothetical protein
MTPSPAFESQCGFVCWNDVGPTYCGLLWHADGAGSNKKKNYIFILG